MSANICISIINAIEMKTKSTPTRRISPTDRLTFSIVIFKVEVIAIQL